MNSFGGIRLRIRIRVGLIFRVSYLWLSVTVTYPQHTPGNGEPQSLTRRGRTRTGIAGGGTAFDGSRLPAPPLPLTRNPPKNGEGSPRRTLEFLSILSPVLIPAPLIAANPTRNPAISSLYRVVYQLFPRSRSWPPSS